MDGAAAMFVMKPPGVGAWKPGGGPIGRTIPGGGPIGRIIPGGGPIIPWPGGGPIPGPPAMF